jgi:uncharacterized membrane protein YhdT
LRAINPAFMAVAAVVIVAFLFFVISRAVGARRRHATTAREEVPFTLSPKTSSGRWALRLAIAYIVLFVLAAVLLRDRWGLNDNGELIDPVLTVVLTIILVGISGAALVISLISVIKRKERSVLVFVSMFLAFWYGLLGPIGQFFI